ncbi:hypothetical protein HYW43_02245 [Candidatus Daviesbacteria bacterium]|nr:hypothetical protein [Candidatus Daviesbacteria bacterium]
MINKQLSTKAFVVSQISILIVGLIFLGGLYYILNIQYQKNSSPFSNGPVTTPPKTLVLDLSQPDEDSLVFKSPILVSGQTSAGRQVLIFTDSQSLVIKSKLNGSFSSTLDLDEGVNKITVVAFDDNGDSKQIQRTLYYSKEKI